MTPCRSPAPTNSQCSQHDAAGFHRWLHARPHGSSVSYLPPCGASASAARSHESRSPSRAARFGALAGVWASGPQARTMPLAFPLRFQSASQRPRLRPSRDSNACICAPIRNGKARCVPVEKWAEQSLTKCTARDAISASAAGRRCRAESSTAGACVGPAMAPQCAASRSSYRKRQRPHPSQWEVGLCVQDPATAASATTRRTRRLLPRPAT